MGMFCKTKKAGGGSLTLTPPWKIPNIKSLWLLKLLVAPFNQAKFH